MCPDKIKPDEYFERQHITEGHRLHKIGKEIHNGSKCSEINAKTTSSRLFFDPLRLA
jgi:hypothetical protein